MRPGLRAVQRFLKSPSWLERAIVSGTVISATNLSCFELVRRQKHHIGDVGTGPVALLCAVYVIALLVFVYNAVRVVSSLQHES